MNHTLDYYNKNAAAVFQRKQYRRFYENTGRFLNYSYRQGIYS